MCAFRVNSHINGALGSSGEALGSLGKLWEALGSSGEALGSSGKLWGSFGEALGIITTPDNNNNNNNNNLREFASAIL